MGKLENNLVTENGFIFFWGTFPSNLTVLFTDLWQFLVIFACKKLFSGGCGCLTFIAF